jgi:hypothetical protein
VILVCISIFGYVLKLSEFDDFVWNKSGFQCKTISTTQRKQLTKKTYKFLAIWNEAVKFQQVWFMYFGTGSWFRICCLRTTYMWPIPYTTSKRRHCQSLISQNKTHSIESIARKFLLAISVADSAVRDWKTRFQPAVYATRPNSCIYDWAFIKWKTTERLCTY